MQETKYIKKTISKMQDAAVAHERTAAECRDEAIRLRTAADALERQLAADAAMKENAERNKLRPLDTGPQNRTGPADGAALPLNGVPAADKCVLKASNHLTTDPSDPALAVIEPSGMQKKYLVLSEKERKKGFVRPLRLAYIHKACGTETKMGLALCETYARNPNFYGGTFCANCDDHFNLLNENGERQFHWVEDGVGVGE